ncbi:hypothetical protein GCM10012283_15560 [Phycicoccus endophyticus]|nr:hypothetical protein GCM10012283_15560 [Phycicoccus endophyticus]
MVADERVVLGVAEVQSLDGHGCSIGQGAAGTGQSIDAPTPGRPHTPAGHLFPGTRPPLPQHPAPRVTPSLRPPIDQ